MPTTIASRAYARIRNYGLGRTLRHVFTAVLPKIYMDLRYGGGYCFDVPELNKGVGLHGLVHSNLADLHFVFDHVKIMPSDVLVDVGCGAGRVLNYWLSLKLPNKLIGIEYDPDTARRAMQTYRRWSNVEILQGDAVEIAPACGGTLFYFFNPLMPDGVHRFEAAVRGRPVRILYYYPRYPQAFEHDAWRMEHIQPCNTPYPLTIITSTEWKAEG
jgi:hypothetical protein